MNDNIREKLRQAKINEVEFIVMYKGKQVFDATLPIPEYAEDVFKTKERDLHYFFKDMSTVLKDKVDALHQELFWERQEGDGSLNP